MSALAAVAELATRRRTALATFFARYPEWWSLALSAGAWVWIVTGRSHHAHAHHGHGLGAWMLMSVAMMVPMTADSIRNSAQRSFWRRRHRAIAAFLAGFLGCWLIAGVVIARLPLRAAPRSAAVALALAAAWQLSRWKRLALAACHWTMPLSPRGWRADRDCVRFGLRAGLHCFASCWALMLACFLAGHGLLATVAGTGVGIAERYWVRDQRLLAATLLIVSIVYAIG